MRRWILVCQHFTWVNKKTCSSLQRPYNSHVCPLSAQVSISKVCPLIWREIDFKMFCQVKTGFLSISENCLVNWRENNNLLFKGKKKEVGQWGKVNIQQGFQLQKKCIKNWNKPLTKLYFLSMTVLLIFEFDHVTQYFCLETIPDKQCASNVSQI